jgi:hypothetical protein
LSHSAVLSRAESSTSAESSSSTVRRSAEI